MSALTRTETAFLAIVFLAGLALRLRLALTTYLNPDEAMHALYSFAEPGGSWVHAWKNSLLVVHPPALILLTHAVSRISRSEIALRIIPVLAGSLFPVLMFVWLRRAVGITAAMASMFLLTLAPHLVTLSAQVRSYTLAFFFFSAALVAFERAIDTGRSRTMWIFSVLLCASVFSDFSMTWLAGGLGVYALARLRGSSRAVKASWAAGQILTLSLYGLLYLVQVRHLSGFRSDALTGWLRSDFPAPGTRLVFPFANTLQVFEYLTGSAWLAPVAFALFALAVIFLWMGRAGLQRERSRAMALLIGVPFALGIAGAYARVFPYGGTRHTLAIGVLGAVGIAIFIGSLPRRAAGALAWGVLLLTPAWHRFAVRDGLDIEASRNSRRMLLDSLAYMRASIPPGALVFTEGETLLELDYYEGGPFPAPTDGIFKETFLAGRWRVAARDYQYTTQSDFEAALAAFRAQYGISKTTPVWVLDGGWVAVAAPPDPGRPFTRAMRVFESRAR